MPATSSNTVAEPRFLSHMTSYDRLLHPASSPPSTKTTIALELENPKMASHDTGAGANAWCLLIHADASLSVTVCVAWHDTVVRGALCCPAPGVRAPRRRAAAAGAGASSCRRTPSPCASWWSRCWTCRPRRGRGGVLHHTERARERRFGVHKEAPGFRPGPRGGSLRTSTRPTLNLPAPPPPRGHGLFEHSPGRYSCFDEGRSACTERPSCAASSRGVQLGGVELVAEGVFRTITQRRRISSSFSTSVCVFSIHPANKSCSDVRGVLVLNDPPAWSSSPPPSTSTPSLSVGRSLSRV